MELQRVRSAKRHLESVFRSKVRGAPEEQRFAMGVAPGTGPGQHRLAVRAPSSSSLTERDLALIRGAVGDDYDLRYTGTIGALSGGAGGSGSSPRLHIGDSIGHMQSSAGTLGFFARRTTDGTIGLVSNNHVIALADGGQDGDEIVQPGPMDGGVPGRDGVARLCGRYPKVRRVASRVDCAFAPLLPDVDFDPRTLGTVGHLTLASAVLDKTGMVGKIGRTTKYTRGAISAFELDAIPVMYAMKTIRFYGQIEIHSADGTPFSEEGDSGALVFTDGENIPVGLLFAGTALGGNDDAGLTYVNPIDAVLTSLGVTFVQ